ncbi:MAG: YihA family ribosome biogenesis GTP-binding protein [Erysipelotrichaceae bacterium]|nr:YihA family ribosome biogenesis GTP-binding protein [Erysipelotrichaceae bacterium]MCI9523453.1 YihA family ribosome biogenesis GTP-binding protein [Erysipelotrichaceae bacterium]
MQFQKAELVISAPDRRSWPDTTLPEIVLAGRSNVGKSSFINAITERKKLAYVGNTPGKTRLLNFFNLDDRYMLVDVPGYGYANLSKSQLMKFAQMMDEYFEQREQKKGMVILVDARHLPSEDDLSMVEYARYFKIPICIVATKIDKVKPTQRSHKIKMIKQALELSENEILIPFSAISKQGIDDVWKRLIEMMEDE